jgi:hypothetical protein
MLVKWLVNSVNAGDTNKIGQLTNLVGQLTNLLGQRTPISQLTNVFGQMEGFEHNWPVDNTLLVRWPTFIVGHLINTIGT